MSYYNTSVDVRVLQNCTVFPVNCFITECVLYMEVCDVVANHMPFYLWVVKWRTVCSSVHWRWGALLWCVTLLHSIPLWMLAGLRHSVPHAMYQSWADGMAHGLNDDSSEHCRWGPRLWSGTLLHTLPFRVILGLLHSVHLALSQCWTDGMAHGWNDDSSEHCRWGPRLWSGTLSQCWADGVTGERIESSEHCWWGPWLWSGTLLHGRLSGSLSTLTHSVHSL